MTDPQMAVLHLSTGHVVGAVAAGERVPTVADATGGEYIAVRIPGGQIVRVTAELLTALATTLDADVLTRPTHFRVVEAVPPLSLLGPPVTLTPIPTKKGEEALSIWDGADEVEVIRDPLDTAGSPPTRLPPGATHRLVAVKGEPLMYET